MKCNLILNSIKAIELLSFVKGLLWGGARSAQSYVRIVEKYWVVTCSSDSEVFRCWRWNAGSCDAGRRGGEAVDGSRGRSRRKMMEPFLTCFVMP